VKNKKDIWRNKWRGQRTIRTNAELQELYGEKDLVAFITKGMAEMEDDRVSK
jgi:hypothetical protein